MRYRTIAKRIIASVLTVSIASGGFPLAISDVLAEEQIEQIVEEDDADITIVEEDDADITIVEEDDADITIVEEDDADINEEGGGALNNELPFYGYIASEIDDNVPDINKRPDGSIAESDERTWAELPRKYPDNLDNLPPHRDQGSYGTCWAHASIALAEINMDKKGLDIRPDYSERALAYFEYLDRCGMTPENFRTEMYNAGGNYEYAIGTLLKWIGATEEAKVPYSRIEEGIVDEKYKYDDAAHLSDVRVVDINNDREGAKRLLQEYGALGISYCSAQADARFYNRVYNSYYMPLDLGTNHSIIAVGWDDDFPAYRFNTDAGGDGPEGNGAWLVRNSWTDSDTTVMGSEGYFWLSYYDRSLADAAYAFGMEQADKYDNMYTEAGEGYYSGVLATLDNGTVGESLEAVTVAARYSANAEYTVKVYTDFDDEMHPEEGTLITNASFSGNTDYSGYYTVEFDKQVNLKRGRRVAVVAETEFGSFAGIEALYTNNISSGSGLEADAQSLALTGKNGESSLELGLYASEPLVVRLAPANAAPVRVTYESSDTSVAVVSSHGEVTGIGIGDAVITARAGDLSDSVTVNVSESRGSDAVGSINPPYPEMRYVGDSGFFDIGMQGDTDDSAYWYSENDEIVSIDPSTGEAFAVGAGTTVIHAVCNGVDISAKVRISLRIPDVCIRSVHNDTVKIAWDSIAGADYYRVSFHGGGSGFSYVQASYSYRVYDGGETNEFTFSHLAKSLPSGDPISSWYITVVPYSYEGAYGDEWYGKIGTGDEHRINYHAGEGQNAPRNISTFREHDLGLIYDAIPPRGYYFDGWYLDDTFTEAYDPGMEMRADHDIDLYAKYNKVNIWIDFIDHASCESIEYRIGERFTLPEGPVREGYSFIGWGRETNTRDGLTCEIVEGYDDLWDIYERMSENSRDTYIPLKAIFTKTVEVSLDKNADDAVLEGPSSLNLDLNREYGQLPVPTRPGYSFAGWWTDTRGMGSFKKSKLICPETVLLEDDPLGLLAKWIPGTASVTFDPCGGTTSVSSRELIFGEKYGSLPSAQRSGFIFDGWYSSALGGVKIEEDTSPVSWENHKIYAHWIAEMYSVTFDGNGGSVGSRSKKRVKSGQSYGSLPAPIRTGYAFEGWFTEAEGGECVSEGDIVDLSGDITLYAHWRRISDEKIPVTLISNVGAAYGRVIYVEYGQPYGNALEKPSGSFTGWYTSVVGGKLVTASTIVTNAGAHNLYAHYGSDRGDVDDGDGDDDDGYDEDEIYVVRQKIQLDPGDFGLTEKPRRYVITPKKSASVSKKGVLTVKRAGEISVIAQNKVGKKYVQVGDEIIINAQKPKLTSMRSYKHLENIDAAEYLIKTTVSPDKWISSRPSVAEIDPDTGEITVHKSGRTKIYAYYINGISEARYSAYLTVKLPYFKNVRIRNGRHKQLKPLGTRLIPSDWSSDDEEVVTVDESGRLTAVSPGKAVITAVIDGAEYCCNVTVK